MTVKQLEEKIRKVAMAYPETTEDHPWGHAAFKVRGKAFVFMSGGEKEKPSEVSLSMKLPQSADLALDTGFAEPTGYGMGKHGWVTLTLTTKGTIPLDVVTKWIDESYRAIAPKTLVKKLGQAAVQ
jgi:predicted DNA-binding protein (MmcQ/YjbR family)